MPSRFYDAFGTRIRPGMFYFSTEKGEGPLEGRLFYVSSVSTRRLEFETIGGKSSTDRKNYTSPWVKVTKEHIRKKARSIKEDHRQGLDKFLKQHSEVSPLS